MRKVKGPVYLVKPKQSFLNWLFSNKCETAFYEILEHKNASISASFYNKKPVLTLKYTVYSTNFDIFLGDFCNPKDFQEYRFAAAECDEGDLLIEDSYMLTAIKSECAAKAYCLLQRPDVDFPSDVYDPRLMSRINTEEKYNQLEQMLEDGYFSYSEANQLIGECKVCKVDKELCYHS